MEVLINLEIGMEKEDYSLQLVKGLEYGKTANFLDGEEKLEIMEKYMKEILIMGKYVEREFINIKIFYILEILKKILDKEKEKKSQKIIIIKVILIRIRLMDLEEYNLLILKMVK